jgi:hypothetical protein
MTERAIPISKKQHDLIVQLAQQRDALTTQVSTAVATVMASVDDAFPADARWHVGSADGVYMLVVESPADPPARDSTG